MKKANLSKKKEISYADKLTSIYVILRDQKCVCCGRADTLQAGHYIGRRHQKLRWDKLNVNCQCSHCNFYHNENPESYRYYLKKLYSEDIFTYFENRLEDKTIYSVFDIQDIQDQLKQDILELNEKHYFANEERVKQLLNKRSGTISEVVNYIRGE